METVIGCTSGGGGYNPFSDDFLNLPRCVLADKEYLYVADTANYILRRYKMSGILS